MAEWISVKDRLPDETEFVLVYDDYEGIRVAYCSCGIFEDEEHNEYLSVTHWQPLPEPPKGV